MSTEISWTDETWNPVTGCTRVSPGCDHCYIARTPPMRMAGRKFDGEGPGSSTGVLLHPDRLERPLRWSKPRRVFVNSMSDLFHEDVEDVYIANVWAVMSIARQHTFQVLTKRHGRMRALLNSPVFKLMVNAARLQRGVSVLPDSRRPDGSHAWPLPNVWLGVSVEDQKRADLRIRALLDTPASVRFLSCEPLLGAVDLAHAIEPNFAVSGWKDLSRLDWVIVGGESGPGARPMHPDWARSLRDQCQGAGVAFHLKQWGEWAPAGYNNGTHLLQVTGQLIDRKSGTTKDPYGHGSGVQDLVDRGHPGWSRVRRVGKKLAGRDLDGRTWDEFPEVGQP